MWRGTVCRRGNAMKNIDLFSLKLWLRKEMRARRERRYEALQQRDDGVRVRNPHGTLHFRNRGCEDVVFYTFLLRDP